LIRIALQAVMHDSLARQFLPPFEDPPLVTNRGGYTLTMRECDGAEEVLAALTTRVDGDLSGSKLHVGWGSFRNLDIVAARRSGCALLLDINNNQFGVWSAVSQALKESLSVRQFIDKLMSFLPSSPPLRQFMGDTRSWLESDLKRGGSWMNSDYPDRFDHVRWLFNEGRIIPYCMDIRGISPHTPALFEEFRDRLQDACRKNNFRADTLYLSNLPWMMQQEVGFFTEAHADRCPEGEEDASRATRRNLEAIVPLFDRVIAAIRLAHRSTAEDLRWQTECFSAGEFLDSASWKSLYEE